MAEAGGKMQGMVWLVQPVFDEGDDYPEETGPKRPVRADSREAAVAEYELIYGGFRGLSHWRTEEISEEAVIARVRRQVGDPYFPPDEHELTFLKGASVDA